MPPVPPILAAIALGSNLGPRHEHLARAHSALDHLPNSRVIARSAWIETAALAAPGVDPGGPYLNAACLVLTRLDPRALLDHLHAIERQAGRDRAREPRWGPRTLDLDLLLYGSRVIDKPGLTVPHPRLHERAFVLAPLAQIGPELMVPTLGVSVRALRDRAVSPTSEVNLCHAGA